MAPFGRYQPSAQHRPRRSTGLGRDVSDVAKDGYSFSLANSAFAELLTVDARGSITNYDDFATGPAVRRGVPRAWRGVVRSSWRRAACAGRRLVKSSY